jgi:hypothetical protein
MRPIHAVRRASLPLLGLLLALASILAASLLTACVAPPASVPQAAAQPAVTREPLTLTVVHTNDTWGYLLPCG